VPIVCEVLWNHGKPEQGATMAGKSEPRKEGSIVQRGEDTFLLRVYMGTDPGSGKRKYHSKTVHGTEKDAQRELRALLHKRDEGELSNLSRANLDAYLDRWVELVARPRLRPQTAADYERVLDSYVRPVIGKKALGKITALDLQALYNGMSERGLSPRTVRYAHAVIRSALGQAVRWQLISRNPADGQMVDLPAAKHREMTVLTAEQVQAFLGNAEGDPHYPLFLLAVTTGMRPGEYLALKWADLDFAAGALSVNRSVTRDGRFQQPKTAKSRRRITLLPTVVEELRAHKRRQAAARLQYKGEYEDLDLVFCTAGGKPLQLNNVVRRHFKPLLELSELPRVRIYDLRHTHATLLLSAGENPKVVSERLAGR